MANEFICGDCGGDGTRCDCHKKRPYRPNPNWQFDRSDRYNNVHGTNFRNDASLDKFLENERELKRLVGE